MQSQKTSTIVVYMILTSRGSNWVWSTWVQTIVVYMILTSRGSNWVWSTWVQTIVVYMIVNSEGGLTGCGLHGYRQ